MAKSFSDKVQFRGNRYFFGSNFLKTLTKMTWHVVYILLLVNYDINTCKLSQMCVHDLSNKIRRLRLILEKLQVQFFLNGVMEIPFSKHLRSFTLRPFYI